VEAHKGYDSLSVKIIRSAIILSALLMIVVAIFMSDKQLILLLRLMIAVLGIILIILVTPIVDYIISAISFGEGRKSS